MLLTVEKVLILKSTSIFLETPEDYLINVAFILKEREVMAGEEIIKKGDIGTSMYIIVDGKVSVHDEDNEFAQLTKHDVFGELAALDPEPRSASITALEDTLLLRLDEGPLYELIGEHVEVTRGIIQALCRRMRTLIA